MRHVKKLAGLVVLTFAAAVVFGSLSFARSFSVTLTRSGVKGPEPGEEDRTYNIESSRGKLLFAYTEIQDRNSGWFEERHIVLPPRPPFQIEPRIGPALAISVEHSQWGSNEWSHLGFALGSEDYRGAHASSDLRYVIVPYWIIVGPLAIASFAILLRYARNKRGDGCCRSCGYDLRATPSQCPECGQIPETRHRK